MLCRCCQSQAISQYGVRRVVNNVLMHKHLRIILGSKSAEDYYDVVGGQCVSDHQTVCLNHLNITRGNPALAAVGQLDVGEAGNIVQDAHAGAFVEDEQVLGAIR